MSDKRQVPDMGEPRHDPAKVRHYLGGVEDAACGTALGEYLWKRFPQLNIAVMHEPEDARWKWGVYILPDDASSWPDRRHDPAVRCVVEAVAAFRSGWVASSLRARVAADLDETAEMESTP